MSTQDTIEYIPYAGVDETVESGARAAVVKAIQPPGRLFLMGFMAGILIGIGFWIAYTASAAFWPKEVIGFDPSTGLITREFDIQWPFHPIVLVKFLLGAVFPLGLIAICIGGAELWTGCCQLIPYGYMRRKFGVKTLLYDWICAYSGNWVGSVFLAYVATFGTALLLASPWCHEAIVIAWKKISLDPWTAFWRGVGCNFLVNLAIWLWLRSKKGDFMGQAFLIWFPIFAFVAIGFEHSIANMFAIPLGIFIAASNLKCHAITYWEFFFNNLLPVTFGNLVGGFIFIALIYWYVGLVKGSKYGEATIYEAIKYAIIITVICGLIHLILLVVIPGCIACVVEASLGLSKGVSLTNAYIVLIPALITGIYYTVLPFIAFKVLKPAKRE